MKWKMRSLAAEPGKTVSVPVTIGRGKGLTGKVKIELIVPSHLRGITTDPVEIAADAATATLPIHFAAELRGPFNAPLLIRATLLDAGKPVIAETKLDLLPAESAARAR